MYPFVNLEPETFYHIYNRGNNKENIFYKKENYRYFLSKLSDYSMDYFDLYSFCLMPNHFHFLVKIKSRKEISEAAGRDFPNFKNLENLIVSERMRRFFLGYSKAINKQENRTGSLFQKNFHRIPVYEQENLIRLICYIHRNPVHHGFSKSISEYEWTSYNDLIQSSNSNRESSSGMKGLNLMRMEVMELFGGVENFIKAHQNNREFSDIQNLLV